VTAPGPDGLRPTRTADRLDRLRTAMSSVPVDAFLVTHLTNVRYLTGFTGSAALLLVTADDALFVTDGRYADQAPAQLGAAGVAARVEVTSERQREIIAGAASGASLVGLEADHVSWAAHDRYAADWFAGSALVATSALVEDLRLVKDPGEIDRIRLACRIADDALADVRGALAERPTEREFGLLLDDRMRRLGASDVSFETIVASGPNGARPHHRPAERIIVDGDLVVIDFGALVDGYHSDMTRTIMVGEPTPTQARMYGVVRDAQRAGADAVGPGVEAKAVDAACREVIAAAGWADAFTHGTGHGVGLDIHEAPRVAATSTATLAVGHVVTVEPGVYLADHGGVRIEDTLVVTDEGAEAMTLTPKTASLALGS